MNNINTDRLILRQWEVTDSKDLYEYAKSDLVGPNAGWNPHKSEEESKMIIKSFIENKEVYAILLKSENKVIGSIGLHNRNNKEESKGYNDREIGYVLNPKYWGNGYVPEAVRALIDYGFNTLNLDNIWCAHFDYNDNSRRVIYKCGFKFQYKKKENLSLLNNREVRTLFYRITKDEYNESIKK